MALVKMTSAAAKQKGRVNYAKLRATSETDIRRHEAEDGGPLQAGLLDAVIVSPSAVREKFKMTQAVFAKTLGIPLSTLRNWEQQRTAPDPAARALLTILYRAPRVLKVLTESASRPRSSNSAVSRPERLLRR